MPLGVGFVIFDIRCDEVKQNIIPRVLQDIGFNFVWTEEQWLAVGPIIEESQPGSSYLRIKQTYYLQIVCDDEITSHIKGEVVLVGLNSVGDWIAITDVPTIEKYGIQFLQRLRL
jgi:hypothetical protein